MNDAAVLLTCFTSSLSSEHESNGVFTMFDWQNGLNMDGKYDYQKCTGLKVKPRQGDGLLFYSVFPNGTIDPVSVPVPISVAWYGDFSLNAVWIIDVYCWTTSQPEGAYALFEHGASRFMINPLSYATHHIDIDMIVRIPVLKLYYIKWKIQIDIAFGQDHLYPKFHNGPVI